ncbi:hypothetical protein HID58_077774 [Brassica napus]|uniref:Uncharacterized protein n=1 Tax=Brassica napus TaxID=3708 RepID=A0ABQ7YRB1_BRANA|nr:hypothetical protein HID58_077774 [Brassica napus]
MRGHVLPSSMMRGHVSHGRLLSATSQLRRRSILRISRPNRSSAAPPNLTASVFGPLKPEGIDRHGEITSTTVHHNHPKKISHAT